jgi:TP901 family phage tail tape measure protein
MVDRTVKVSLVAQVSGYVAGMELAAAKTRQLGTAAEQLAAKRAAFESLGRPLLVFGAVAAAAVGIAIKKFADFDQAMSNVAAVTEATAEEMGRLSAAALDAGGRTVFTATEAAHALEELGKASFTTNDAIAALDGTLALAAAGQLEVARAAEIVATTIKQYGLAASEAGRVSDVLAAAAGKALGSVEDIAQAMKFVGPVAASMGISLEETAGALALFANQGVLGEQAGTSLRGVLSSLTSPSKEAAAEIERLGISLYDSTGSFVGLEGLAGELGDAFQKADDKSRDFSLGLIFGNMQVTAARVLFAGGAEAIADYTAQVTDAGYAAQVAAARMDNLKGDLEKLSGALDTALIKTGSSANAVLRDLTQSLTYFVDGVGNLPEPVLGAGLAVGTVTAAIALAGGAALLAVPKVAAFNLAMKNTAIGAKGAAVAISGIAGAVGIATLVIGAYVQKAAEMDAVGDALVDSLDKTTGAFTDYSREIVAKRLQESGAAETAAELGISLDVLTNAAFGNVNAMRRLKEATEDYSGPGVGGAFQNVHDLTGEVAGLRGEIEQAPGELAEMQAATEDSADAYQHAAEQVASLQSELNSLIETIQKANGLGQDAVSTNASYQAALAASAEAVAEYAAANGASVANIDASTAAGSKNAAMFADLAQKSQDAAKAQFDLDGNADNYIATLESGRQALYDQILGLTGSAEAAQDFTNKIYAIPSQKEVDLLVDAAQAKLDVSNFFTLWNGRVIRMSVQTSGTSRTPGFASGGPTPGHPTLAWVGEQGTEFVSTAKTTANPNNRRALEFMHAGGDIRAFAGGGYTSPQMMQAAPAAVRPSMILQVTVPVTSSVIGDEDFLAATVGDVVSRGLQSGTLPADWYTGLSR